MVLQNKDRPEIVILVTTSGEGVILVDVVDLGLSKGDKVHYSEDVFEEYVNDKFVSMNETFRKFKGGTLSIKEWCKQNSDFEPNNINERPKADPEIKAFYKKRDEKNEIEREGLKKLYMPFLLTMYNEFLLKEIIEKVRCPLIDKDELDKTLVVNVPEYHNIGIFVKPYLNDNFVVRDV